MASSNALKQVRQRSDSVLGNRMDENLNFRRIKPAGVGSRWHKLRRIIEKDTTKVVLFEVPKGFNITEELEALDLGDRLRSVATSSKIKIKRFQSKSNKNCIMAIESAFKEDKQTNLEASHLNQIMCLLPAENKVEMQSDASNSEDLSGDEKHPRLHNLEAGKAFAAHIKICSMATDLSSKSANECKISHIIKRKPVH